MTRILMVLTSHDKKGSTGERAGAYLPEISHPSRCSRTLASLWTSRR